MDAVVLENVLPVSLCEELIALQDILQCRGYRPQTCMCHLSHTVLAHAPHLSWPLLKARELVRDRVQEAFQSGDGSSGYTYYFVEFTGLLVWLKGSTIGWHSDSDREYLKQRKISSVVYLNSQSDFEGGTFHFKDESVRPEPGKMVAYVSDKQHRVEPIARGRRYTLALWFTDSPDFSEDKRLMEQFKSGLLRNDLGIPDEFYKLEDGSDLRLNKLADLGFGCEKRRDSNLFLLTCPQNKGVAACESLTEAVHLAISIRRFPMPLKEMHKKLSLHNQELLEKMQSCWICVLRQELGEIYIPDKYDTEEYSLFPDMTRT